mmetsp:Transcript_38975/g.122885  ORF Transcript_38975/g.122885 Transcript_38975/m.122885 type:complete len:384 (+) Transcript_38975:65-1216(+)
MGARCSVCREEGLVLEQPGVQQQKAKQDKQIRFWHEKMRFSHASQALFDASLRGDETTASEAIRALGDPNACSKTGYRALQVAISCGNYELVDVLLKASADINGCAQDAPPPLVLAAGCGDVKLFARLLEGGGDPSLADTQLGETPLVRAAERGHLAIVQRILGHGTPGLRKVWVQRSRAGPLGDGATALHVAAVRGDRTLCDRLLGVGADPNAMDRAGRMALHGATESGHVEAASVILAFGASPAGHDREGVGPLHVAAERGHESLADLLVRSRADANAQCRLGRGPLHMAAMRGHDALVLQLLAARAEPSAADASGEAPFALAFRSAHTGCCRALLEAGAEVRAVDSNRWSPPYTELEPGEALVAAGGAAADETFRDLAMC